MPASTNASYVGRLAPPGRPNTTSTPSALRHSITASTARMRFPLPRSVRSYDTASRRRRLRRQCSPKLAGGAKHSEPAKRRLNPETGGRLAPPARPITGSCEASGAQHRTLLRADDDERDRGESDEHGGDGRDQRDRVGVVIGGDNDLGARAAAEGREVAIDGGAVGRLVGVD